MSNTAPNVFDPNEPQPLAGAAGGSPPSGGGGGFELPPPPAVKKAGFERPTASPEIMEQLEARYGDVHVFSSPSEKSPWSCIIRRPTRQETMMWKTTSRSGGSQAALANEQLLRKIIVFPNMSIVELMITKWSVFPDAIVSSTSFQEFIGLVAGEDLKG